MPTFVIIALLCVSRDNVIGSSFLNKDEAMLLLLDEGYIEKFTTERYRCTEKGNVYIAALLQVPKPIATWRMP